MLRLEFTRWAASWRIVSLAAWLRCWGPPKTCSDSRCPITSTADRGRPQYWSTTLEHDDGWMQRALQPDALVADTGWRPTERLDVPGNAYYAVLIATT